MPELLKLTNMGNKGLSTDTQPWSLPAEYLTFGANFRVFAGALSAAGGHAKWVDSPTDTLAPGHIIHVGSVSGDYWLVCGRDAVYAWDGTTWTDVSSTAGYAGVGVNDELQWASAMLGQIPIINNSQAQPEFWSPQSPGQIMQPLPFDQTNTWSDMGFSFQILRSHRNFLFAMNLQEGLAEFPDSYRWSHPADINGIPPTWDETNDAFLAGKASLGGDGGQIIDGQSLRDSFVIYSENAIDILDFSNDEFIWNRRELSATVGLLARNCVVEVKGRHFFLADGDIVMNDGTNIQSIAHNRIRRQLNSRINVDNYQRSFAVRNNALKEVWFCVVEEDAVYPNVAYIYNWQDDSWALRELPYAETLNPIQSGIAYAGYGSQSIPTAQWEDFTDLESWDSQTLPWGSASLTPLDDTVVGVNPSLIADGGGLYFLDPFGTPDDDIRTRLERTDYPLVDVRQVTTITRVYPHIRGTQPLSIQFGSQDFPGAAVRWKPAVTFTPDTDRKIDVRTTGELHCWRFDSIGKGTWTMSGLDIEWEPNGVR